MAPSRHHPCPARGLSGTATEQPRGLPSPIDRQATGCTVRTTHAVVAASWTQNSMATAALGAGGLPRPPGHTIPQGNGLRAFLVQQIQQHFQSSGSCEPGGVSSFRIKETKGSRGHVAPMARPQEAPKEDSLRRRALGVEPSRAGVGGHCGPQAPQSPPRAGDPRPRPRPGNAPPRAPPPESQPPPPPHLLGNQRDAFPLATSAARSMAEEEATEKVIRIQRVFINLLDSYSSGNIGKVSSGRSE